MKIYKIGQSVLQKDLVAVELWVEDAEIIHDHLPETRLMGGIHGNEDQGIFILMGLINHYSIGSPAVNSDIYQLLRKVRLHVLVAMNPDGFYASRAAAKQNNGQVCWTCGRNNQQNEDLNRNFPFLYPKITERKFFEFFFYFQI